MGRSQPSPIHKTFDPERRAHFIGRRGPKRLLAMTLDWCKPSTPPGMAVPDTPTARLRQLHRQRHYGHMQAQNFPTRMNADQPFPLSLSS
jgi:hypothetical protein